MATKNFPKVLKMVGVSEFRAELAHYLEKARLRPIIISDRRGDNTYVVLSGEDYNKLVEAREDAIDGLELERLVRENKNAKFIPWESVRKR